MAQCHPRSWPLSNTVTLCALCATWESWRCKTRVGKFASWPGQRLTESRHEQSSLSWPSLLLLKPAGDSSTLKEEISSSRSATPRCKMICHSRLFFFVFFPNDCGTTSSPSWANRVGQTQMVMIMLQCHLADCCLSVAVSLFLLLLLRVMVMAIVIVTRPVNWVSMTHGSPSNQTRTQQGSPLGNINDEKCTFFCVLISQSQYLII